MKKIFQNAADASQRLQMLRDNCTKSEMMNYSKELTNEEVEKERFDYTQKAIDFQAEEDAFKERASAFNDMKKEVKQEQRARLGNIKTGLASVTEEVFLLANHEDGNMEFYNAQGDMIHVRKLTPKERQSDLVTMNVLKTGTE